MSEHLDLQHDEHVFLVFLNDNDEHESPDSIQFESTTFRWIRISIKRDDSCVPGFQGRWLKINPVEGG